MNIDEESTSFTFQTINSSNKNSGNENTDSLLLADEYHSLQCHDIEQPPNASFISSVSSNILPRSSPRYGSTDTRVLLSKEAGKIPKSTKQANTKNKYSAAVTLTPRSAKRVNQRTGFVGYLPNLSPFFSASLKSPLMFFHTPTPKKRHHTVSNELSDKAPKFPVESPEAAPLKKTPSFKEIIESVSDGFSLVGSSFNLCSATLGAGVLSLPYAFKQCGIIISMSLLLLAGLSTSVSIDMLVESSTKFIAIKRRQQLERTGKILIGGPIAASYEEMSVALLGKSAGYIVETCIIMFCFGTAVAYIVAVGDIIEQGVLPNLTGYSTGYFGNLETREGAMIAFWFFVMFPLSLFEKINSLRCASVFGVLAIFYLVFVCVLRSTQALEHRYNSFEDTNSSFQSDWWESDGFGNTISLWPRSIQGVFAGLPIIMFAFSCQVNVISIYEELETASLERMSIVANSTVAICVLVYLLAGGFGYLEFGSATLDNVLTNFCVGVTRDPLVITAYICITVTVVMAFPLNIFPCRYTMDIIFRRCDNPRRRHLPSKTIRREMNERSKQGSNKVMESKGHQLANQKQVDLTPDTSRAKHFFLTFLISGSALFCALIVPNLSLVFSLMGGTASAIIGFILPGLFALRLRIDKNKKSSLGYWLLAWTLVIGGIVVGILSTTVTIYGMIFNNDGDALEQNSCSYLIKGEITDDSAPIIS